MVYGVDSVSVGRFRLALRDGRLGGNAGMIPWQDF